MNIRNFDLNLLVIFDALMRERNVSRAAERLSRTQPAVSNALNRLRQRLQDPLLVRTQRGMAPTQRALELLGPVQSALAQLDDCLTPPPAFDPTTSHHQFVLGTTDYVTLLLLPQFLERLRYRAPGVEIQIKNLGPIDSEVALETRQYDFAIGRFLKTNLRLEKELWLKDKLCCLVRRDHPITTGSFRMKEFVSLEYVWVTTTERRGLVDTWLQKHNYRRRITLTVPSYTTGAMIVSDTDMGLVLPQRFAQKFSQSLPVIALPLPRKMNLEEFDVDLMWHPLHASTPAHQWLRRELKIMSQTITDAGDNALVAGL